MTLILSGLVALSFSLGARPLLIATAGSIVAIALLTSAFRKRQTLRSLRASSDSEFLAEIREYLHEDELSFVSRSRDELARAFGVPTDRLSSDVKILDLGRCLNFLGSFSIAFNDLHDDLEDLFGGARMPVPSMDELTVGQLVVQMARARRKQHPGRDRP